MPRQTPKQRAAERAEYVEKLRKIVPKGARIYVVRRKRSPQSGAMEVDFYLFTPDETEPDGVSKHWLTYMVCKVTGHTFKNKSDACWLPYMNMDPGFAVVNQLTSILYPDAKPDERLRSTWL